MTLNDFINKLIEIRDTNNICDYTVSTSELVYDIMCGEIQYVYLEPVAIQMENIHICENSKNVWIEAINN